MKLVFFTALTILFNLEFAFHINLVPCGYVILTFTLRADKRNYLSGAAFCHMLDILHNRMKADKGKL